MTTIPDADQRIEALHRLAVATREKADPETLALYLDGTAIHGTTDFVLACRRLENRSAWFPKKSELIAECVVVQGERWGRERKARALPAAESEPTFKCRQCLDAGWISLNCPETRCLRPKEHGVHSFAVRCPCWLRANADVIRTASEKQRAAGKEVLQSYDDVVALMGNTYRWANYVTVQARTKHEATA